MPSITKLNHIIGVTDVVMTSLPFRPSPPTSSCNAISISSNDFSLFGTILFRHFCFTSPTHEINQTLMKL
jgi:hypothetical protein